MSFDCANYAVARYRAIRYRPLRLEGATSCHNEPDAEVGGLGYEVGVATPVIAPGDVLRADFLSNYGPVGSPVGRARPVRVHVYWLTVHLIVGGTIEAGDVFRVTLTDHKGRIAFVETAATGTTAAGTAEDIATALRNDPQNLFGGFAWTAVGPEIIGKMSSENPPPTVTTSTTEAGGGAADGQTFNHTEETEEHNVLRFDGAVACPPCVACWICEDGVITAQRRDLVVAESLSALVTLPGCGDAPVELSFTLERCKEGLVDPRINLAPCAPCAAFDLGGTIIASWQTPDWVEFGPDWSMSHPNCEWLQSSARIAVRVDVLCGTNSNPPPENCHGVIMAWIAIEPAVARRNEELCPDWADCCGGVVTMATGWSALGCAELELANQVCGAWPEPKVINLQTPTFAGVGQSCSSTCGATMIVAPASTETLAARTRMAATSASAPDRSIQRPARRQWIGAKAQQFAAAVTGPTASPEVQAARLAQCGSNACGYLLKIDPRTRNVIAKAARALATTAGLPAPEDAEWYCRACGCSTYNPLAELHNKTKYAALECPCDPPYWPAVSTPK